MCWTTRKLTISNVTALLWTHSYHTVTIHSKRRKREQWSSDTQFIHCEHTQPISPSWTWLSGGRSPVPCPPARSRPHGRGCLAARQSWLKHTHSHPTVQIALFHSHGQTACTARQSSTGHSSHNMICSKAYLWERNCCIDTSIVKNFCHVQTSFSFPFARYNYLGLRWSFSLFRFGLALKIHYLAVPKYSFQCKILI